jgi:hypothetical protein
MSKNLHQACLTFLEKNYVLYINLFESCLDYFIRDFHEYISSTEDVKKDRTTYVDMSDVKNGGKNIRIRITHTNNRLLLLKPLMPCVSHELLMMNRDGLKVSRPLPLELKNRPSPLLYILNQISNKHYTWLSLHFAHLLPSLFPSTDLAKLLHTKWMCMLEEGFTNQNKIWTFVQPQSKQQKLTCFCMDEEETSPFIQLPCKHVMHLSCFVKIKLHEVDMVEETVFNLPVKKCPYCNREYKLRDL